MAPLRALWKICYEPRRGDVGCAPGRNTALGKSAACGFRESVLASSGKTPMMGNSTEFAAVK